MSAALDNIRAAHVHLSRLKARSTQGTHWEHGDRQHVAGVLPEMFGEGRCGNCKRGEPAWVGRTSINGRRMLAHVHVDEKPWWPHGIYAWREDGSYIVVNDTQEYGTMREEDAELIITLHATLDAQLRLLALALEYGDLEPGRGSGFIAAAHELARSILGSGRRSQ